MQTLLLQGYMSKLGVSLNFLKIEKKIETYSQIWKGFTLFHIQVLKRIGK